MKKLARESEMVATSVFNPLAMSGNAGKYISIENGPMDVSKPRIKTRRNFLFLSIKAKLSIQMPADQ